MAGSSRPRWWVQSIAQAAFMWRHCTDGPAVPGKHADHAHHGFTPPDSARPKVPETASGWTTVVEIVFNGASRYGNGQSRIPTGSRKCPRYPPAHPWCCFLSTNNRGLAGFSRPKSKSAKVVSPAAPLCSSQVSKQLHSPDQPAGLGVLRGEIAWFFLSYIMRSHLLRRVVQTVGTGASLFSGLARRWPLGST